MSTEPPTQTIQNLDAWHLVVLGMFEIYNPEQLRQRNAVLTLGTGRPFANAVVELQSAELVDTNMELTDKGRTVLQHLKGSFRMTGMYMGFRPPEVSHPTARDAELQQTRFVTKSPWRGGRGELNVSDILTLLLIHAWPDEIKHPMPSFSSRLGEHIGAARKRLNDHELTTKATAEVLTPRGLELFRMLVNSPLPVATTAWRDPRTLDEPDNGSK